MLSSCWSQYCPSVQAFIQLYRNQDFCIWKYRPSVWGNDTYITTFKILLLVARIAYPQASEKDVHYVLALFDLLKASGSQYLLTSLCYISQYFVLKAVVFLSLLHSSWSQGKRNFSHLYPPTLFPINTVKWVLIFKPHPRQDGQMREGDTAAFSMLSPAGWTTPTFTGFLSPPLPVGWAGGADSFCPDSASRYVVQPGRTKRDGKCRCAAWFLKRWRECAWNWRCWGKNHEWSFKILK